MHNRIVSIAILALLVFAASCSAPQKTIYFSDNSQQNLSVQVENIERIKEVTILPGDIISITVSSISGILAGNNNLNVGASTVAIFNEGGMAYSMAAGGGGGGGSSAGNTAQNKGYLVDQNGYIDYPIIGKLKLSGLTLRQVKELIADKLVAFLKEPIVDANIINFRITVSGEVGHEGYVFSHNQKISIIDAIAASGGIPITGRKDNILIVRETEGKREFARLNLNSRNVFNSPYFYLKQNDIVYVEPSRVRRQENNDFLRFYLPTLMTLVSSAITLYSISKLSK
jgi:polysaccharide export outer membrane protein